MHLLREKLGQTAVGNPNEQHVVSLPLHASRRGVK